MNMHANMFITQRVILAVTLVYFGISSVLVSQCTCAHNILQLTQNVKPRSQVWN